MSTQLTIRNVPDDVRERLDQMSRERGESLNTVVVGILAEHVGVDARRARLARYATWTDADAAEFDAALAAQRTIDAELWR
ncbi:MAG: hypothetical protein AB1635_15935 [Acidobacteriota bacterium]